MTTPERYISDGISFTKDEDRQAIKDNLIAKYHHLIRAKGSNIIIAPFVRAKKTAGGIILTDSSVSEDQFHSVIAQVIDIGPLCYTDEKFTGPVSWCEIGDWIVVPRTGGQRVLLADESLRIIAEGDITAIVAGPEEFKVGISATKY